jgi:hypothetical protein
MIEVKETGGWCWLYGIRLLDTPPSAYTNQGSLFPEVSQ